MRDLVVDYTFHGLRGIYIQRDASVLDKPPRVDRKPRERIVLSMDEWHTLTVNKQVVKRNFGADVRKEIEKSKTKLPSSWYFTSTKSVSSVRTVPFGDTLYNALKAEHARQKRTELVCGERYTVHYLKKELDEKGDAMQRIISVPKLTEVPFPVSICSA